MTDASQRDLQRLVEDVAAETGVTGVAVGVIDHGSRLRAAAGVANVESGRAMTPSTLCQVGSISKTFAAATLLCLVDDGLVALDEPVSATFPSSP